MQYAVSDVNDHDRYKILTAFVLPRPIAWVTTVGPTGTVNAAPFSFFNVFAEDPPIVMFAVNKRPDGRIKDTWTNIKRTGEFVVNLTDEPLARAMHDSSGDFPPDVGEPDYLGLKLAPSVDIKPPQARRRAVVDGVQDLAGDQRQGRPPAHHGRGPALPHPRRAVGPQGHARAHGEVPSDRPHVRRPLLPHRRSRHLSGGRRAKEGKRRRLITAAFASQKV